MDKVGFSTITTTIMGKEIAQTKDEVEAIKIEVRRISSTML